MRAQETYSDLSVQPLATGRGAVVDVWLAGQSAGLAGSGIGSGIGIFADYGP
jgi:hypothetical protein